jgi:hypothetical protein
MPDERRLVVTRDAGLSLDRWSELEMPYWATSEYRPRLIVDGVGAEWEVYDESVWSLELALDWEVLPQHDAPGLIFSSSRDRRRLWPCPANWKAMSDQELLTLLGTARSIH